MTKIIKLTKCSSLINRYLSETIIYLKKIVLNNENFEKYKTIVMVIKKI